MDDIEGLMHLRSNSFNIGLMDSRNDWFMEGLIHERCNTFEVSTTVRAYGSVCMSHASVFICMMSACYICAVSGWHVSVISCARCV